MELKITVIGGDGIGPEVTREALRTVESVCRKFGHRLVTQEALCGAVAIESTGEPFPDAALQRCKESDAVLFGAVGDPRYDNDPQTTIRPEQGLLAIRKQLGLYANLRPVITFPALLHNSPLREELVRGADILCVREFTGGIYYGTPRGRSEEGTEAFDTCRYSRREIERVLHVAYRLALKRRKKVTVVDKANILATSRLWREVAREISLCYSEVHTDYLFVDNAAMRLVQWPLDFDVLVTENLFGDILTDEAAVISGSMGLLPSASIGEHTPLFEPVHGSWPQATGKGIANPVASILSAAMMFDEAFALPAEARTIREAVNESIEQFIRTPDIQDKEKRSYTTSQVGKWIANYIKDAQ